LLKPPKNLDENNYNEAIVAIALPKESRENNNALVFLKYVCGQCFYFSFSTHKQCILNHLIHNSTAMFP
jgi:hypothetical protein